MEVYNVKRNRTQQGFTGTARKDEDLANSMKNLQKKRLQRKAYADPDMHRELVKIISSPVYNANAELIQAVTSSRGSALKKISYKGIANSSS